MLASYPVLCTRPGCGALAGFKVAARWSDGTTHELKTYALACAACVPALYAAARDHQREHRDGREMLGEPGVYERLDLHDPCRLARRPDLETDTAGQH